ncbi:hypothetical protein FHL15_005706 [Xylaria flabelliformis]|uniref:Uncharacterized protein n=1 Tax=Xylaria flabelliformis TaxID=2512241 RepID=A0A553HZR3_9PEZI|nr:hypothetical protein FHL15_005706 [Xylaria flabelliformis]
MQACHFEDQFWAYSAGLLSAGVVPIGTDDLPLDHQDWLEGNTLQRSSLTIPPPPPTPTPPTPATPPSTPPPPPTPPPSPPPSTPPASKKLFWECRCGTGIDQKDIYRRHLQHCKTERASPYYICPPRTAL